MTARLTMTGAALALLLPALADAEPVPSPIDAGADGPPLVAQAPPPGSAPLPSAPPEKRPPVTPSNGIAAADRPTIQRLHDANQLQIQMGRLAQQRGASRPVKNLGRKLVADHTAADKNLDAYLRKHKMTLTDLGTTTAVDSDHELLATRTGAEFDRSFALQTVADHTKTIDMLQSASIATFDDDLRDLYNQMVETEETHKRDAQEILAPLAHK